MRVAKSRCGGRLNFVTISSLEIQTLDSGWSLSDSLSLAPLMKGTPILIEELLWGGGGGGEIDSKVLCQLHCSLVWHLVI